MKIEAKNRIATSAFLAFLLVAALYIYGEVKFALYIRNQGWQNSPIPIKLGFIIWTAMGAYEVFKYIWLLAGRERVFFEKDVMEIKRGLFGIWVTKRYRTGEISNKVDHGRPFKNRGWKGKFSIQHGRFSFEYEKKPVDFGIGLDEKQSAEVSRVFIGN